MIESNQCGQGQRELKAFTLLRIVTDHTENKQNKTQSHVLGIRKCVRVAGYVVDHGRLVKWFS